MSAINIIRERKGAIRQMVTKCQQSVTLSGRADAGRGRDITGFSLPPGGSVSWATPLLTLYPKVTLDTCAPVRYEAGLRAQVTSALPRVTRSKDSGPSLAERGNVHPGGLRGPREAERIKKE